MSLTRLEFFSHAPAESDTRLLAEFISAEVDYDAKVGPRKKGCRFSKREWIVTGWTQQRSVSLDILNWWVEWMVLAGAEHGRASSTGGEPRPA